MVVDMAKPVVDDDLSDLFERAEIVELKIEVMLLEHLIQKVQNG